MKAQQGRFRQYSLVSVPIPDQYQYDTSTSTTSTAVLVVTIGHHYNNSGSHAITHTYELTHLVSIGWENSVVIVHWRYV